MVSVLVIKEMVERQEAQVMVGKEKMVVSKERVVMGNEMVGKVGKERAGRGELSKAMRGEHGRDLKRLRLGQEQEKEVVYPFWKDLKKPL